MLALFPKPMNQLTLSPIIIFSCSPLLKINVTFIVFFILGQTCENMVKTYV